MMHYDPCSIIHCLISYSLSYLCPFHVIPSNTLKNPILNGRHIQDYPVALTVSNRAHTVQLCPHSIQSCPHLLGIPGCAKSWSAPNIFRCLRYYIVTIFSDNFHCPLPIAALCTDKTSGRLSTVQDIAVFYCLTIILERWSLSPFQPFSSGWVFHLESSLSSHARVDKGWQQSTPF